MSWNLAVRRPSRPCRPSRPRRRLAAGLLSSCLLSAALVASPAAAQWTSDTTLNTEVSTAIAHTVETQIVDGPASGTFVLWDTVWAGGAVYLQFVNSAGFRMPTDEVVSSNGYDPVMTADGAGGVIVVWRDGTLNLLRAARYDASLNATWGPILLTTSGLVSDLGIISDGAGGAIVAWSHRTSFSAKSNVRAQRVDSLGVPQWTAGGFAVTNLAGSNQRFGNLAPGGAGGDAFIAWEDDRSGDVDIWARYVDESGTGTWAVEQPVVTVSTPQRRPQLVADGAGGVVVGWQDDRNGLGEPFAQRLSPAGLHLWSPWNGIRVGQGGIYSGGWEMGPDGSGGAVFAWSSYLDIRYQQVTPSGGLFWGANGLPITSGATLFDQRVQPAIDADGAGGAVIAWGTANKIDSNVGNIYAQFVSPGSGPEWAAGGITVSNASDWQGHPDVVAAGECPAKVSFTDYRDDGDAYVQRILCPGIAGLVALEHPHELSVAGTGPIGVIGHVIDLDYAKRAEFDIAFDRDLLEVLEVVPGTFQGLESSIDREAGVVTVRSSGGEIVEGRPFFELKVRARAPGAATVTFTRAEIGGAGALPGLPSVIEIGERSRR